MKKPSIPLVALAVLITAALLVSGCVGQAFEGYAPDDDAPAFGPGGGNFTARNITDAERAQMEAQRVQACAGKAEGDACEMQLPSGIQQPQGMMINGSCTSRNGTIACEFTRRNGNFTGNWTGGPRRMLPT